MARTKAEAQQGDQVRGHPHREEAGEGGPVVGEHMAADETLVDRGVPVLAEVGELPQVEVERRLVEDAVDAPPHGVERPVRVIHVGSATAATSGRRARRPPGRDAASAHHSRRSRGDVALLPGGGRAAPSLGCRALSDGGGGARAERGGSRGRRCLGLGRRGGGGAGAGADHRRTVSVCVLGRRTGAVGCPVPPWTEGGDGAGA